MKTESKSPESKKKKSPGREKLLAKSPEKEEGEVKFKVTQKRDRLETKLYFSQPQKKENEVIEDMEEWAKKDIEEVQALMSSEYWLELLQLMKEAYQKAQREYWEEKAERRDTETQEINSSPNKEEKILEETRESAFPEESQRREDKQTFDVARQNRLEESLNKVLAGLEEKKRIEEE